MPLKISRPLVLTNEKNEGILILWVWNLLTAALIMSIKSYEEKSGGAEWKTENKKEIGEKSERKVVLTPVSVSITGT